MKIVDERFAVLYLETQEPTSVAIIPPRALYKISRNPAVSAHIEDCTIYADVVGEMFVRVPAGARIGAVGMSGRVDISKMAVAGAVNSGDIDVIGDATAETYAVTDPVEPGDVYRIGE